jgi:hypothetical protein
MNAIRFRASYKIFKCSVNLDVISHSQFREKSLVRSKIICVFPSIILAAVPPFLEAAKSKATSISISFFPFLSLF